MTSVRPENPAARRLLGRVAVTEAFGAVVRLSLDVPGWGRTEPGQFALLHPEPSRVFLGRALSVCEHTAQRLCFLVAPVGAGTRELSALEPGDAVWVTGPLGNGFDLGALAAAPGRIIVVAGGVGVAPFALLLDRLAEDGRPGDDGGGKIIVLAGFRDYEQARGADPLREAALRARRAGLDCVVEIVTEDGSCGPAEKVTDLLARRLLAGDRLAVCGPQAMVSVVWQLCRQIDSVAAWFSLETTMACGAGSCHGCVVQLADGSYARVCHEGPVFSGREIFGD
jgi:dihydroorotate dehydrogenase electron transfer subunit